MGQVEYMVEKETNIFFGGGVHEWLNQAEGGKIYKKRNLLATLFVDGHVLSLWSR